MRFPVSAVLMSVLLGLSSLALAQTPFPPLPQPKKQSPEEVQKMLDTTMGSMLPMMERMMEMQFDTQLKLAERPATAERIAAFKKNLFDALRRKGFTVEESIQIINSTPMPAVATGVR